MKSHASPPTMSDRTCAADWAQDGPPQSSLPSSVEPAWVPRLLIIDHDDSYTLNLLVALLHAIQRHDNDEASASFLLSHTLIVRHSNPLLSSPATVRKRVLPAFDAIILGPGPGRPDVAGDFDAAARILATFRDTLHTEAKDVVLPTLGVCLGLQGIATAFGGSIRQAQHLRHGLPSKLEVLATDTRCRWRNIFHNLKDKSCSMTTYNSLVVDEASLPNDIRVTAIAHDGAPTGKDSHGGERVVMALQHDELPIWGVQFHPESIESTNDVLIFKNFLENIKAYWKAACASKNSELANAGRQRVEAWRRRETLPHWLRLHNTRGEAPSKCQEESSFAPSFTISRHNLGKLPAERAPQVFQTLFAGQSEEPVIWLDSARPGGQHSRYSYMAKPSWSVQYDHTSRQLCLRSNGNQCSVDIESFCEPTDQDSGVNMRHGLATPQESRMTSPVDADPDVQHAFAQRNGFWSWLDAIQRSLQIATDYGEKIDEGKLFKAGFIGYMSYEMKCECIPLHRTCPRQRSDDIAQLPSANFGFCDRVLVLDHETDEWTAFGVLDLQDSDFARRPDRRLERLLEELSRIGSKNSTRNIDFLDWTDGLRKTFKKIKGLSDADCKSEQISLPLLRPVDDRLQYISKVEGARKLIAQGQSYELCLTTEFHGKLPRHISKSSDTHFALYESLRRRNPAPFSAFLRLNQSQSILSTSPEKFMSIDIKTQTVEMKPIKGTSARAGYGRDPPEARKWLEAKAGDSDARHWCAQLDEKRRQALQMDVKERAENLMIVDLIRRDLLDFCSPETVKVPKLMAIESYETVHQLVTTVQGRKPVGIGSVEALARCFPPGSMTGAPKIRSVELLEALERKGCEDRRAARGIYSGILGWIGMDGSASFNVLIRTVVLNGRDVTIGAGGAITYLSSAEQEWQEVLDKVGAVAQVDST